MANDSSRRFSLTVVYHVPHVAEIIGILRPQLDECDVAQWLNTRIDVYRGRSAAEMLRAGELHAVLIQARGDINRWAN